MKKSVNLRINPNPILDWRSFWPRLIKIFSNLKENSSKKRNLNPSNLVSSSKSYRSHNHPNHKPNKKEIFCFVCRWTNHMKDCDNKKTEPWKKEAPKPQVNMVEDSARPSFKLESQNPLVFLVYFFNDWWLDLGYIVYVFFYCFWFSIF